MLEMNSNYSKWASYFKVLCGKFGLRSHIDGPGTPHSVDPQWVIADSCVKSWLFGSVGDSVLNLALAGDDQTARQLWAAIEDLFTANQEPRAVLLLEQFHMLTQGDSTISEYCQPIKLKAAELRAVGHPVEGRSLIVAMLHGLHPRFASTADDITNSTILLTFSHAHDMLILMETRLSHDEKAIANTALLASTGSGCTSPVGCLASTSGASSSGTGGGQMAPPKLGGGSGNKKKGARKGNGGGNNSGAGGGRTQQPGNSGAPSYSAPYPYRPMGPWICYNPWAPQGPYPSQQQGPAAGA
ncbi:uncharacterized protein LOC120645699 [Panicum virgatum]|uniref:uncharacterized protein LOC120645699 n=1 Tax=Panicum virgatum TaxID=38727 RepID=UPI0019D64350|nr:uncharacterized protein LOC120645699 [Panicum virgatum]